MDEYDEVYTYLESGTYPEGLSKNGKRNWRRKCKENFKIENGQLYHRKCERKPLNEQQEQHGDYVSRLRMRKKGF